MSDPCLIKSFAYLSTLFFKNISRNTDIYFLGLTQVWGHQVQLYIVSLINTINSLAYFILPAENKSRLKSRITNISPVAAKIIKSEVPERNVIV